MASILEAYDTLMKLKLKELESHVEYVKKAKQHPALVERKEKLLERQQVRYSQRRAEIEKMIQSGNIEQAKLQFISDTGREYVAVVPVYTRKSSPRRTIKQKYLKSVFQKGGPVHPNILPKHMVNAKTKKIKGEYRYFARYSNKKTE